MGTSGLSFPIDSMRYIENFQMFIQHELIETAASSYCNILESLRPDHGLASFPTPKLQCQYLLPIC